MLGTSPIMTKVRAICTQTKKPAPRTGFPETLSNHLDRSSDDELDLVIRRGQRCAAGGARWWV